uniref:Uncharacterized protein n=1 Tax=Anguilla anguilla TaxID=7936 RepID=A0A0E9PQG0_ANGAN
MLRHLHLLLVFAKTRNRSGPHCPPLLYGTWSVPPSRRHSADSCTFAIWIRW